MSEPIKDKRPEMPRRVYGDGRVLATLIVSYAHAEECEKLRQLQER